MTNPTLTITLPQRPARNTHTPVPTATPIHALRDVVSTNTPPINTVKTRSSATIHLLRGA
jgi:hypothetical protein